MKEEMMDGAEEAPLFVVGASRSGTTMLRLMLNSHPRIGIPHEFKYLRNIESRIVNGQWRQELGDDEYAAFVDNFLGRRGHIFSDMDTDSVRKKILADPERTVRSPYRISIREWARHYGKSRWGEKTPFNLYYVDVLHEMFPEARFLYMIRDPRAVVTSMNDIEFFSDDTVLNALNWRKAAIEGYNTFLALPEDQRIVVRYEDLVDDPATVLNRICAFMGEDFDNEMLKFYKDSRQFMNPVIRTENVTRAVNSNSAERWRDELSHKDVAAIEFVCKKAMVLHGYALTTKSTPLRIVPDVIFKSSYFNLKSFQHRNARGYTVRYPAFARFQSTSGSDDE